VGARAHVIRTAATGGDHLRARAYAAHSHMPAIPRDSSTVILVKSDNKGARVLLIRRHTDLAFAGGTWVFPGGKLEVSDTSARAHRQLGLGDAAEIAGQIVCACRETFEETGIVLAQRPNGASCDSTLADSLQPFRAGVSRDPGSFASLLTDHDLHFCVAEMPTGQTVRCDSAEATEFLWLDLPRDGGLLDESLIQAPPTRFSVGDLAFCLRAHGSLDRLMQRERTRVISPIMPKILRTGTAAWALLPWDPDYTSTPGEGTPSMHIPTQYLNFPSRIEPPTLLKERPAG
jgi:8-oxo-dGTP pyrophosphatase MutT (NUDIX family)